MNDQYSLRQYDYQFTKGETANIFLEFYDDNGDAVDVSGFGSELTVYNPVLNQEITSLFREHDDVTAGGGGLYYMNDTQAWPELALVATNQIQAVWDADETDLIQPGQYPFELCITSTVNGKTVKVKAVRGTITIRKEWSDDPTP